MATRFRTAARLTSKPLSSAELESLGYDDGKASAFRGDRYVSRYHRGGAYQEGFSAGYWRVAGDGGLGR